MSKSLGCPIRLDPTGITTDRTDAVWMTTNPAGITRAATAGFTPVDITLPPVLAPFLDAVSDPLATPDLTSSGGRIVVSLTCSALLFVDPEAGCTNVIRGPDSVAPSQALVALDGTDDQLVVGGAGGTVCVLE